MKMKKYNPKQNYYFIDYGLEERGHPEYIKEMKKEDPSHCDMGCPRWVRSSFNTEQDVQEQMNILFNPYPDKITDFRVRSETELNEIVTIDVKTNKVLYKSDEGFDQGIKMTQREYDFGTTYQWLYDYETGVIDDEGLPKTKEITDGLNQKSKNKFKEMKGTK